MHKESKLAGEICIGTHEDEKNEHVDKFLRTSAAYLKEEHVEGKPKQP